MDLYLMRHGLAAELGTAGVFHDAERSLTEEGERKVKAIAKAIQAMDLSFDLILSSPCVRARQTAELVAQALHATARLQLADGLVSGENPCRVVETLGHLKPMPTSLLLVGHEPSLSELASLLVAGDSTLDLILKKGGLCKLTVKTLKAGRCAALDWWLTPRQMLLMT